MITPHAPTKDPVCGITMGGVTALNAVAEPAISAAHRAWKISSSALTDQPRKTRPVIVGNKSIAKHAPTMSSAIARTMRPLGRLGFALIVAVASSSPAVLMAAELPNEPLTTEHTLTVHCYELRAQRQLFHAEVAAQNADLAVRIAAMNSAGEGQKLALLSALITQMAEQKAVMDERKEKLEDRVIRHLMEHMMEQKSMDGTSIAACPLMDGVKVTNDPVSNDHNEPRAPAPR